MTTPNPQSVSFAVTAIVAAYNEEDIIGLCISHLIRQGVSVYLLDHGSTDGTAAEARPFLGKGLIAIERFPEESGFPAEDAQRFAWAHILRRKQELAQNLASDWFIHHDADEFRESPWPHRNLCQAIRAVDQAGYNAIDFAAFDFPPTDDSYRKGHDLRTTFRYCEPVCGFNRLQINAWKKSPVDLVSSGGHEAIIAERRVFPIRFLMRHYPIRNQAQGERKVLQERRARWDPAERARGWHVQYDGVEPGHSFIRDPSTLTAYDSIAIRLQLLLRHRGVEELEGALDSVKRDLASAQREVAIRSEDLAWFQREWGASNREQEQAKEERDTLARRAQEIEAERNVLAQALGDLQAQRDSLALVLSDVQAQRDSLAQSLNNLQVQHDSLALALNDVQAQRDSLARTRDDLQGQHDLQGRTLHDLRAQHDALVRRSDELGTYQVRLQARIDELVTSWSWRATGPVREILRRLRGY